MSAIRHSKDTEDNMIDVNPIDWLDYLREKQMQLEDECFEIVNEANVLQLQVKQNQMALDRSRTRREKTEQKIKKILNQHPELKEIYYDCEDC